MNIKSTSYKFGLSLFLLVCAEAFIILVLLGQGSADILGGDAHFYEQAAHNLLQNGSFAVANDDGVPEPTMERPPGYAFFLACVYFFFGNSVLAVRIIQFILFWLTAFGIYRIAKYTVDEKTARLSAGLSVTYLPLVFFNIYHLSEILATFLLVWTVYNLFRWKHSGGIIDILRAALLFACLSLVRPNWALFAIPIFILFYIKQGKNALSSIVLFGFISALLFSPWLIRNYLLSGKIILSSVAKQTLYLSFLQYEDKISYAFTIDEYQTFIADKNKRWKSIVEEAESTSANETLVDKELLLEATYQTDLITERKNLTVSMIFLSLPKRLSYLWSTSDYSPKEIYNSFYHRIAQIHFIVITLLILLGLFFRRHFLKTDWFLIAPAVYITLIHLVFLMESRYSIPARPFLLIFASAGIVGIIDYLKSILNKQPNKMQENPIGN